MGGDARARCTCASCAATSASSASGSGRTTTISRGGRRPGRRARPGRARPRRRAKLEGARLRRRRLEREPKVAARRRLLPRRRRASTRCSRSPTCSSAAAADRGHAGHDRRFAYRQAHAGRAARRPGPHQRRTRRPAGRSRHPRRARFRRLKARRSTCSSASRCRRISRLWTHPAVYVSPHNAAVSTPEAIAAFVARQIEAHERGEPLTNLVDRRRRVLRGAVSLLPVDGRVARSAG